MKTKALMAGLTLVLAVAPASAQEHAKVNSPTAIHEQTVKHLQAAVRALNMLGTPETAFDYVAPAVSGPVVVLQGFTINGPLKKEAESAVKNLGWVVHVVNEIEYLDVGPELRRQRQQTLGILQKMVPQAFPENHANIRIKVTQKGDITLVGVISPVDKVRFEAAIEQIKQIDFVESVTNHVVEQTS